MKKWMPIKGDFIKDGENIIFMGMGQQLADDSASMPFLYPFAPDGIVLFEDIISTGEIEANVKFDNFNKGDLAQIVFSYQNDYYYMCAGVTNLSPKYGFFFRYTL